MSPETIICSKIRAELIKKYSYPNVSVFQPRGKASGSLLVTVWLKPEYKAWEEEENVNKIVKSCGWTKKVLLSVKH